MKPRFACALLTVIICLYAAPAFCGDMATYVNQRFGFAIGYPQDLLYPQGESANGDGQTFVSKDGRAVLIAYGAYNALDQSLDALLASDSSRNGRRTTYTAKRADWFVISGYEPDGRIFYQKTLLRQDVLYSFELRYPQQQKARYNPLTGIIGKSFRILQ